MIHLLDATVAKFGVELFKSLTLNIASSENVIIRGHNGAGKTTLLELIAGKIHPKRGKVLFDFIAPSEDWEHQHQLRQKTVHLIPSKPLHQLLGDAPDLFYQRRYYDLDGNQGTTVKDFLRADRQPQIAGHLAESLELANLLDVELIKLSNGQIKKVVILKHLLSNIPRLLLLDYPFEGLDRQSRIELNRFLDLLVRKFAVQLIITDHHDELPDAINTELHVDHFDVSKKKKYEKRTQSVMHIAKAQAKLADPLVDFRNVTIQYGERVIIRNLNWTVHRGERWALTGRNGSGKTTLFSMIYADHPLAYSQNVSLFGKRRGSGESIWDIKRRINYLGPEHVHFLDSRDKQLTASAYLTAQNSVGPRTRVSELISIFGIEEMLHKEVGHLSSGELQLLLLIRFFLSDKELLLLDEPFQFLDDGKKKKVNQYLNTYIDDSKTLILITHYEEDVAEWTNLRIEL